MAKDIIELTEDGSIVIHPELIDHNSSLPSVLALSLPKAGSVMLDGIMKMLCKFVDIQYVSIMEAFFNAGIDDTMIPPETCRLFKPNGVCYGGFRYFPVQFEVSIVETAPALLLVRDPRDMITSLYFSALKSHPPMGAGTKNRAVEAAQTMEIDEYAKYVCSMYKLRMGEYASFISAHPDTKLFRYEDIVYDKRSFVEQICEHLQWDVSAKNRHKIAAYWDTIPRSENPNAHLRQVHPGNFKAKLAVSTIEFLNSKLVDEMKSFGYYAQ